MRYAIVIEKAESNFSAYVPDLPGCVATGATVMKQAKSAGAVIVKPAQKTFWGGYAGYFEDPNHHLWEVVWNPQLLSEE